MKLNSEQTRRMDDFIRRKWLDKPLEVREHITSKLREEKSKMNEATYDKIRKSFDKSMMKIDWIEDRETRETLESLQIQMNRILFKHFESNRGE